MIIKREKTDEDAIKIKKGYASSSEIRELISEKGNVRNLIPKTTFDLLKGTIRDGELVLGLDMYEQEILYNLRKMSLEEIAALPDVSEGLENKIKKSANEYSSLEAVIEDVKTKRYTETRIKRILLHSLLDITQKDIDLSKKTLPYARVLAFNAQGKKMISAISKQNSKLNIIISVKNFIDKSSNKNLLNMLTKDVFATNVYTLGYQSNGPANLDFTKKVIKL